ncbi:MAG: radical SAM protein [Candidatus Woesearchaeota archaeon]|nr:radical SAM protein [Candidatus Woesearchaeota archaeon]MDP7458171.1 radical SAM protein [Candidatus Woesearchaeota archaeon]
MRIKILKGLLRSKLTKKPVLLSHLVTRSCNLDCPYCLWKKNGLDAMNTEEVLKVHSDAAKNGFIGCFLWGGEPLLRKDIDKILAFDRKLGWWITMATNGSYLMPQAEAVAKNVNDLLVSIDSPSTVLDKIRKEEGTFEACKKGIRAVKAINPKCNIKICCVISKHNKDSVKEVCAFAQQEKCGVIFQHIDKNPGLRKFSENPDINQEERDQVIKEIITLKEKKYPIFNSYTYLKQFMSSGKKYSCRSQNLYFTVWPNGEVSGCATGKYYGNVLKDGIRKILNSPEYASFLKVSNKCSKCNDSGTWETTHLYSLRGEALLNLIRSYRMV